MGGLAARLGVAMLRIDLDLPPERPLRILAIGAHPDDIDIGCGGTLLRLAAEHPNLSIEWLVLSADATRAAEAAASPAALLPSPWAPHVTIHSFRDAYFPGQFEPIKEALQAVRERFEPDLILCHRHDDAHQDHRLIGELTPQVFRDRLILGYEIPKWDGDVGQTNFYVTLDDELCRRKVDHLLASFPSQHDRSWFTEETFRAILRLRAIEAGPGIPYAEGFVSRKVVL